MRHTKCLVLAIVDVQTVEGVLCVVQFACLHTCVNRVDGFVAGSNCNRVLVAAVFVVLNVYTVACNKRTYSNRTFYAYALYSGSNCHSAVSFCRDNSVCVNAYYTIIGTSVSGGLSFVGAFAEHKVEFFRATRCKRVVLLFKSEVYNSNYDFRFCVADFCRNCCGTCLDCLDYAIFHRDNFRVAAFPHKSACGIRRIHGSGKRFLFVFGKGQFGFAKLQRLYQHFAVGNFLRGGVTVEINDVCYRTGVAERRIHKDCRQGVNIGKPCGDLRFPHNYAVEQRVDVVAVTCDTHSD